MIREQAYRQVVGVLPPRLRQEAFSLPLQDQCRAEELRLRVGQPMSAVFPEGERPLGGEPVRAGELEQLVEIASRASVHAVLDQLRRGYLTVEGGHRIGLCGTAVLREGEIHSLRQLSSAAIRVARQVRNASDPVSYTHLPRDRQQPAPDPGHHGITAIIADTKLTSSTRAAAPVIPSTRPNAPPMASIN